MSHLQDNPKVQPPKTAFHHKPQTLNPKLKQEPLAPSAGSLWPRSGGRCGSGPTEAVTAGEVVIVVGLVMILVEGLGFRVYGFGFRV